MIEVRWIAAALPVFITRADADDGGYLVTCPVITGCLSQGDTIEEAVANIDEAIGVCILVSKDEEEARLGVVADASEKV